MAANDQYDAIIVGCGNVGSVPAARLSELPALGVLVLEAGGDHATNPKLHMPAGGRALWSDPSINWQFKTLPQANRRSIDNFGLIGNKGWTYDELQPYYRNFHTYHEPDSKLVDQLDLRNLDPALHGTSGPVQVSYGNYVHDLSKVWSATFKALGHKAAADPLSGNAVGAVNAPGSVDPRKFTRSYAAAGYLSADVRQRQNLHIVTKASVQRVLIDSKDSDVIARGVQYITEDGHLREAHGHEVILCGGVFNSPQLLELSGIGNNSILQDLQIEAIVDLPGVGENLQDHSIVGVSLESTIPTLDSFRDPAVIGAAMQEYKDKARGPFTSAIFNQAYLPCIDTISVNGQKELKEILDEHAKSPSPGLQRQYDLVRSIIEDPAQSSIQYLAAPVQLGSDFMARPISDEARKSDYITLFASLSHPFSRGTVHARTSNIDDPPLIDPKYFSNPADREIMARHLHYLQTIYKTEPLASIIKQNGLTMPADLDLESLDYARNLIKIGRMTHHPCGTCSMMPREHGGVVDSRLRVYGVKGLRVVDASVFPLIPRGNIQTSVYAVA